MKITEEIPESEVKEICRVTGENKKGPAIRKLVTNALMVKRRENLASEFIDGEWRVELKGFEAGRRVTGKPIVEMSNAGGVDAYADRRQPDPHNEADAA